MRNCDEESNASFYLGFAPDVKRCPWATIPDEAFEAMEIHSDYTRLKILPCGGSDPMTAPAYVVEAIKAVDDAIVSLQADEIRKQQREAQKGGK